MLRCLVTHTKPSIWPASGSRLHCSNCKPCWHIRRCAGGPALHHDQVPTHVGDPKTWGSRLLVLGYALLTVIMVHLFTGEGVKHVFLQTSSISYLLPSQVFLSIFFVLGWLIVSVE